MGFTVNVLWITSVVTQTVSGMLPLWNATTLLHWVDIGSVKVCAIFPNPHCILVAFGGDNHGEHARPLKRFDFIAIQYLRWLWAFLGISNSGITVFSVDLLETVVTITKSQKIK